MSTEIKKLFTDIIECISSIDYLKGKRDFSDYLKNKLLDGQLSGN